MWRSLVLGVPLVTCLAVLAAMSLVPTPTREQVPSERIVREPWSTFVVSTPSAEPFAMTVDQHGNVYVAMSRTLQPWGIEEFTSDGRFLARRAVHVDDIIDSIGVDTQGNVYALDILGGSSSVLRVSLHDDTAPTRWQVPGRPSALAVDRSGFVYIAYNQNSNDGINTVRKFTSAGDRLAEWQGDFSYLDGIAVDPQGNVFVADQGNNRIQRLAPGAADFAVWSRPGQQDHPRVLATDMDGNVYVAHNSLRVRKYSRNADLIAEWQWDGLPKSSVMGIDRLAVAPGGVIYAHYFGDIYRLPQLTVDDTVAPKPIMVPAATPEPTLAVPLVGLAAVFGIWGALQALRVGDRSEAFILAVVCGGFATIVALWLGLGLVRVPEPAIVALFVGAGGMVGFVPARSTATLRDAIATGALWGAISALAVLLGWFLEVGAYPFGLIALIVLAVPELLFGIVVGVAGAFARNLVSGNTSRRRQAMGT